MRKLRILLLVICSVVFIYSAYNLISYYYDAYINAKTYNEVKDLYIPAEVVIEDAQGETEEDIEARLQALREENFRKLREINKDIVAWIHVPGTDVDYPVVHGEDNSYYLNHDIEGKTSRAGAIFLDYRITVNGTTYDVAVEETGASASAPVAAAPKAAAPAPAAVPAATGSAGSVVVSAPMPGKILSVKTEVGASVKKGDVLIVLEAMKMENEIVAPEDGTVASVNAQAGSQVESGDTLVTLN